MYQGAYGIITRTMGFIEEGNVTSEALKQITLAQWRARIISNILRDGLIPGAILRENGEDYLESDDQNSCGTVDGRYLSPVIRRNKSFEPYYIRGIGLRLALYGGTFSILPVISERRDETPLVFSDRVKAMAAFSERTSASFLIVCADENEPKVRKFFLERRRSVPLSAFSFLVFPQTIWESYLVISPEAKACPIPIKTTVDVIKRNFGLIPKAMEVEVLDYETPLQEIMNEVRKPIWVHGVRLPIEEDLERRMQTTHG